MSPGWLPGGFRVVQKMESQIGHKMKRNGSVIAPAKNRVSQISQFVIRDPSFFLHFVTHDVFDFRVFRFCIYWHHLGFVRHPAPLIFFHQKKDGHEMPSQNMNFDNILNGEVSQDQMGHGLKCNRWTPKVLLQNDFSARLKTSRRL